MSTSLKTPTFPKTEICDFREEEETMSYEFTKKESKSCSDLDIRRDRGLKHAR